MCAGSNHTGMAGGSVLGSNRTLEILPRKLGSPSQSPLGSLTASLEGGGACTLNGIPLGRFWKCCREHVPKPRH